MEKPDFGRYCRRLDVYRYPGKRRDVPKDIARLRELVDAIELEDKIIIDAEDYRE